MVRIIAFAPVDRFCGNTGCVLGLASALSRAGRPVLLVDGTTCPSKGMALVIGTPTADVDDEDALPTATILVPESRFRANNVFLMGTEACGRGLTNDAICAEAARVGAEHVLIDLEPYARIESWVDRVVAVTKGDGKATTKVLEDAASKIVAVARAAQPGAEFALGGGNAAFVPNPKLRIPAGAYVDSFTVTEDVFRVSHACRAPLSEVSDEDVRTVTWYMLGVATFRTEVLDWMAKWDHVAARV
jgi:hypothetical protein